MSNLPPLKSMGVRQPKKPTKTIDRNNVATAVHCAPTERQQVSNIVVEVEKMLRKRGKKRMAPFCVKIARKMVQKRAQCGKRGEVIKGSKSE